MTDELKRGLRPKRPPKYRASDEEDPEHPSYNRPNYAKLSAAIRPHEYVSPSVVLNQNAKILVKFINKSNKCIFYSYEDLRDMRALKEESEKEVSRKESIPKEKISAEVIESVKKQVSSSRNQKTEGVKKNKELYNFKGLHQNSELLKNITQEQVLKGVKGMESLNGLINNKGIYSGPLSSQLSQLQSLYPYIKDLNYQSLTQSHNPNLFQFNQQSPQPASKIPNQQSTATQAQNTQSQQHKSLVQPPNEGQKAQSSKPAKVTQPKKEEKEKPNHEKIFKRSSYHVAIAYHIYLKGLQEQGITSGNLIDPTYKARLIKEQAGMTNDEE